MLVLQEKCIDVDLNGQIRRAAEEQEQEDDMMRALRRESPEM